MSPTLAFHESLWNTAKAFATEGQHRLALRQLQPLLQNQASSRFVLLAHRLAGRIYLAQEKYQSARRHFRIALQSDATCSATWYDRGLAFEKDPYGCDRRAAQCYRKAVTFSPNSPKYLAALGLALVRLNRVNKGIGLLQQAAELAVQDLEILAVVVQGYLEADRIDEAAKLLQPMQFLHPNHRRVRSLVLAVRHAQTAASQRPVQPKGRNRVMPFLKIVRSEEAPNPSVGGIVRLDAGHKPMPHFQRTVGYRGKRG